MRIENHDSLGKLNSKEVVSEIGFGNRPYFLIHGEGKELIPEGSVYIGIETDKKNIDEAKRQVSKAFEEKKEVHKDSHFVLADGENLPLPEKSADKLLFRNVFGAPGRFFKQHRNFDKYDWMERDVKEIMNYTINDFPFPPDVFHGDRAHLLATLSLMENYLKKEELEDRLNEEDRYHLEVIYRLLEPERAEQQAKAGLMKEAERVLKQGGKLIIIETDTPLRARLCIEFLKNNSNFYLEQYIDDQEKIENVDNSINDVAHGQYERNPNAFIAIFKKI